MGGQQGGPQGGGFQGNDWRGQPQQGGGWNQDNRGGGDWRDGRGGPGDWRGGPGGRGGRDDWRGGGWRGGPGRGPDFGGGPRGPGPGFPGNGPGFPGGPGPGPGFPGGPGPGPGGPGPGFPGNPGGGGNWQGNLVQVHRFFTGSDHLYTTNVSEGQRFGFQYDGVGFTISGNNGFNMAPIFRCFTGFSHFISRDGNCEGQRNEGLLGFVSASPSPQFPNALNRCYNGQTHLITTNAQECFRNGYRVEGNLGFVL